MTKYTIQGLVWGTILSVSLIGCSSQNHRHKGAHHGDYGASHSSRATSGAGQMASFSGQDQSAGQGASMMAQRTFRFDFDSYHIHQGDMEGINRHAAYLRQHPNTTIRVEGHTDEQGSREYNVGLGERRSKAVRNVLISHGVSPSQIRTVSYGEEKPEAFGNNEDAYSMNRRAEIVYEEQ